MKECKYCNKQISDKKSFCNKECRDNYNEIIKYTKTTCDFCGKEFNMITLSYRKWENGKQNTKCCSIECNNRLISKLYLNKTGITKVCPNCNKEFYVKPYLVEQKIYCCRKCYDESRIISSKCEICGREYKVNSYQYNKFMKHFCSKECKDYYMNIIYAKSDEGRNHIRHIAILGYKTQLENKLKPTSIELEVETFLKNSNIECETQKFMHDKFFVDFYLPQYDIIIETFGDYWHGNPRFYNEDLNNLNNSQIRQRNKDKSRISYLSKTHKHILILWEEDIINDRYKHQILELIN